MILYLVHMKASLLNEIMGKQIYFLFKKINKLMDLYTLKSFGNSEQSE